MELQRAQDTIKARRFAATFRDGVSKGENRDSPLWLLVRIHFAPTLKFLKFKQSIATFSKLEGDYQVNLQKWQRNHNKLNSIKNTLTQLQEILIHCNVLYAALVRKENDLFAYRAQAQAIYEELSHQSSGDLERYKVPDLSDYHRLLRDFRHEIQVWPPIVGNLVHSQTLMF